jgi:6-phosphogluconolactonase
MTAIETEIYDDADQLAAGVAGQLVRIVAESIERHGRCLIALAGGSTPKRLYQLLASDEYRSEIDWSRVHVFLSDERYVPLDHDDSNFKMARESLLEHVPLPTDQIHPVPTHLDASEAARAYESSILDTFGSENGLVPAFDLVLLGIGGDGHTASLFPGTQALDVDDRLVVENWVPQQDAMRITFTIPMLHAARNTILMAAGEDKCGAVQRTIEGERNLQETPCQLLRDAGGTVIFALDRSAARELAR